MVISPSPCGLSLEVVVAVVLVVVVVLVVGVVVVVVPYHSQFGGIYAGVLDLHKVADTCLGRSGR